MPLAPPKGILQALALRESEGSLRSLRPSPVGIDLCSNDYLGLSSGDDFLLGFVEWWESSSHRMGATGSRLVSGNFDALEELESFLAHVLHADRALLFASGFEANSALLGALGGRNDIIFYDEQVHASMREGVRLSVARAHSFRHNDPEHLQQLIMRAHEKSQGEVYVAVESVYSMDGDVAPLAALTELCTRLGAHLIVDEAHATGLYGEQGTGLVQQLQLEEAVFARVHTFGKALGFRGACVVGSEVLRSYLVNFARAFIYSTGPDLFTVWATRRAFEVMLRAGDARVALWRLVEFFGEARKHYEALTALEVTSPIQGVILPGNSTVLAAEKSLEAAGFGVRAMRSPTVPRGRERLRICLHSFNTFDQVSSVLQELNTFVLRIPVSGLPAVGAE